MQEDCKRCGSVWDGPLCDTCHDVIVAELRALHERVFLASVTAATIGSPDTKAVIGYAHATAICAIGQHARIMAERDAAIEAALKGGGS